MPYISPEPNRAEIDPNLTEELFHSVENVGDLNYVVTRLALRLLMRHGVDFGNIVAITGSLDFVSDEIKRRFVSEYEDLKLEKNGDIPEYAQLLQWLRHERGRNFDHAPDTIQPHG